MLAHSGAIKTLPDLNSCQGGAGWILPPAGCEPKSDELTERPINDFVIRSGRGGLIELAESAMDNHGPAGPSCVGLQGSVSVS